MPFIRYEISRGSKVPRVAKSQRVEGRGDAEPAEQRGRRKLIPPLDTEAVHPATPVHDGVRRLCLRSWGSRTLPPVGESQRPALPPRPPTSS